MGLIRKKPGQKIKIFHKKHTKKLKRFRDSLTPAKFWVFISLFFLFLSILSWYVGDLSVDADVGSGADLGAQASVEAKVVVEEEDEDGGWFWAEDCKKPEDHNLAVICGQVTSGFLDVDEVEVEGEGGAKIDVQRVGKPLENVIVATYEMMPDSPTGKNEDGSLGHLFSATVTNKDGNYRITKRKTGPKANGVYVAFLCSPGNVGALKKVNSYYDIPKLDVHVACRPPKVTPDLVPTTFFPLATLDYTFDGSTLTCATNLFNESRDNWVHPLNFSALTSKSKEEGKSNIVTSVETWVSESNYDARYVSKEQARTSYNIRGLASGLFNALFNFGGYKGYSEDGAYWYKDCEIRRDTSDADMLCSREEIDAAEGFDNAWLSYNFLDFIPETPKQQAYRSKEVRANPTAFRQDTTSLYSFLRGVFGGVADTLITREPRTQEGFDATKNYLKPMPCSMLKNSKSAIQSGGSDASNYKFTAGPGLGLATPYSDLKILEALDSYDLGTIPICSISGVEEDGEGEKEAVDARLASFGEYLTLDEILDPKNNLKEDYYIWYLPLTVLLRGSSVLTHSMDKLDSIAQEAVRKEEFYVKSTEGANPGKSGSSMVYPEGPNAQTSVSKLLAILGIGDTKEGGLTENYSAVLNEPYSAEELGIEEEQSKASANNQVLIEDVGAYNADYCPVSSVYGDIAMSSPINFELHSEEGLLGLLDGAFQGPEDHADSIFSGSALFRTDLGGLLRDVGLVKRSNVADDGYDSALRFAAEEEKVDFSKLQARDHAGIFLKSLLSGVLGGDKDKYFADRQGTTGIIHRDGIVSYPLNKTNFEENFPALGSGGYPGSHGDYPWVKVLPKDGTCNVYPGVGEDPRGKMRTCKVTECLRVVKTKTPDGKVKTSEEECTLEEKIDYCLTPQKTTWGQNHPDPLSGDKTWYDCQLERAGPYTYIAPLNVMLEGKLEQSDPAVSGAQAKPAGGGFEVGEYLSNAFMTPYQTKIAEVPKQELDYKNSGNVPGGYKNGVDVPLTEGAGLWGIPTNYYRVASEPRESFVADLNPIHYYCLDFRDMYDVSSEDPEAKIMPIPEESLDSWSCSSVDMCMPPPDVKGKPDWVAGGSAGGSCNVCTGGLVERLQIPGNFQQLINTAAAKYNVPGSLILGIMFGEGSFESHSNWNWTSANVDKWMRENAVMDSCDPCLSGAQGPGGFLKSTWESAASAVEGFLGRPAQRCNLADHVLVLASFLSKYGSGGCSSWTEADVSAAAKGHRGFYDPDQQAYVKSVWRAGQCP